MSMDPRITRIDHGERGEYRAHPADSDHIGRLTWFGKVDPQGTAIRVADHTIVPPEIGGRGIATGLVEALIADAREKGFKIVPQCSFVAAQFQQHPDWSDLLA